MGQFLNRGNEAFAAVVNGELYVDKTDMIGFLNKAIHTEQRYLCVCRPHRFGKSVTAGMVAAYFGKGCDSRKLFTGRKLSKLDHWDKNLNQYDVIQVDLAGLLAETGDPDRMMDELEKGILFDLRESFPGCLSKEDHIIPFALDKVHAKCGARFVIVIDDWDCLFLDARNPVNAKKRYLQLLYGLFKGNPSKQFTALAYLTGILPIKKENSESALNNFYEYTMISPKRLANYFGFTETEVQALCEIYAVNYKEVIKWYGGYHFPHASHICSPGSAAKALLNGHCENFRMKSDSCHLLKRFFAMDFPGLREAIVELLEGHRVKADIFGFENDLAWLYNKDDVLTALIHFGYVSYDTKAEEICIPNLEARQILEQSLPYFCNSCSD
jgi:hypothetical protein